MSRAWPTVIAKIPDSVPLKQDPPPSRLLELSLTVDDYLAIEEVHEEGMGLRQVVELEVRQQASPAPGQIGQPFDLVGKSALFPQIDKSRKDAKKVSTQELERIVERRPSLHTQALEAAEAEP